MFLARAGKPVGPSWSGPLICPEYVGYESTKPGNSIVAGHTETPMFTPIVPLVILVFGQSNAISIAPSTSFVPSSGAENFDFYNGRNYVAKDPLLGCERAGGNVVLTDGGAWATRLISKMIDADMYDRIIVVNCSIGATGIGEWQDGGTGVVAGRLRWVMAAVRQAGLKPHAVLQMLGESNALAGHTASNYTSTNRAVVDDLRRFGCVAPVFVSQTTLISGATAPNMAAIRQGQADTWSDALGIYQGPDTDTLTGTYRQADATHLSDTGVDACADLWLATLQAWETAHGRLIDFQ